MRIVLNDEYGSCAKMQKMSAIPLENSEYSKFNISLDRKEKKKMKSQSKMLRRNSDIRGK